MGRFAIEALFLVSGGIAAQELFKKGAAKGLIALLCLIVIVGSAWHQIYRDLVESYAYSPVLTLGLLAAIVILTYLIATNLRPEVAPPLQSEVATTPRSLRFLGNWWRSLKAYWTHWVFILLLSGMSYLVYEDLLRQWARNAMLLFWTELVLILLFWIALPGIAFIGQGKIDHR